MRRLIYPFAVASAVHLFLQYTSLQISEVLCLIVIGATFFVIRFTLRIAQDNDTSLSRFYIALIGTISWIYIGTLSKRFLLYIQPPYVDEILRHLPVGLLSACCHAVFIISHYKKQDQEREAQRIRKEKYDAWAKQQQAERDAAEAERRKKEYEKYRENARRFAEQQRRWREQQNKKEQQEQNNQEIYKESENEEDSFFSKCKNISDLKKRQRALCKELHPDSPSGDAKDFVSMQTEFEQLMQKYA